MGKLKQWLRLALPFIELATSFISEIDDNETGLDDEIASFLRFVIKGIKAITDDNEDAFTNAKAEYANSIMDLPKEVVK